jgi:2,5-diketo-D-gluconate reductase A
MAGASHPSITLNDGVAMPQFGLGVWQTPAGETAGAVRTAVEAGYRMVDTAAIYRNEEGVGEALADHPEIFVTTKLWNSDQGYDPALKAFEVSARKLRREVVDLYLIHWPAPRQDRYVESWKALVRLREEGRVRSIGVSNFYPEQLARIVAETGVTPAVNQVELHPTFQQRRLRETHERLGIATESWSPLGQGRLLEDPTLAAIGEKHGKTAAQVIIRWHLDNDLIVIPKSVHAERIRQNAEVFDFRLDGEDLARITALDDPDGRIGPDPMTANF